MKLRKIAGIALFPAIMGLVTNVLAEGELNVTNCG